MLLPRSAFHRLTGALLAAIHVLACTTAPRSERPTVAPHPIVLPGASAEASAPPPQSPVPLTSQTSFVLHPSVRTFRLTSASRIDAPSDTLRSSDSLETSALLTLRVDSGPTGMLVFASLDSIRARFTHGGMLPAAAALPPVLVARIIDGRITRPDSTETGCTAGASPYVGLVRDLVPAIPAAVPPGTHWTDTTIDVTCRSGIPITMTAHSESELIADAMPSRPSFRVVRRSNLRLTGTGVTHAQAMVLEGRGTRTTVFTLDPILGALTGSDEESRIDLTVTTGTKTQHFLQSSRQVATPLTANK